MVGSGGSPPRPGNPVVRDASPPPSRAGVPRPGVRAPGRGGAPPPPWGAAGPRGAPCAAGSVRRAKDGHLGTGTDRENPTV